LGKRDDGTYYWDDQRPQSIGRLHGFHGNVGVLIRALSFLLAHGGEGLADMSAKAVLNANYVAHGVTDVLPLGYPEHQPMHEFVSTASGVKKHGVRALDICKRLIDLGYHPPTNYFPLIVDEALMIEPTETETPETLDDFVRALRQAVQDAEERPEILHDAPTTTPVRRLDEGKAGRDLILRWTPAESDSITAGERTPLESHRAQASA
jgi:glycine dehydrogenase subunit 2